VGFEELKMFRKGYVFLKHIFIRVSVNRLITEISPNWQYYFSGITFGKSQKAFGVFYRVRK